MLFGICRSWIKATRNSNLETASSHHLRIVLATSVELVFNFDNPNGNKLMKNALCAIAILALCGCSVRYAPRVPGFIPGYVDTQMGQYTYQVKVGEAWPKDWQDLEKFAIYRAAEITKENGHRYFSVTDASSRVSHYAVAAPTTTTTTGYVTTTGRTSYVNATSTTTGGTTGTISGGWYYLEFRIVPTEEISKYSSLTDSNSIISDLKFFIDSRR